MCKVKYVIPVKVILPWQRRYGHRKELIRELMSKSLLNQYLDAPTYHGVIILTLREELFMPHHIHDAKSSALRQRGCLHPRPDLVADELFAASAFFDPRDLLQVKYEMLRRVRVDGYPVSRSAAGFGLSRPTFYQARAAFEAGGLAALVPKKRGPRHAHKLSEAVMEVVQQALTQQPQLKAGALAELVQEQFGISVHPRSVERALARQEKKRQP